MGRLSGEHKIFESLEYSSAAIKAYLNFIRKEEIEKRERVLPITDTRKSTSGTVMTHLILHFTFFSAVCLSSSWKESDDKERNLSCLHWSLSTKTEHKTSRRHNEDGCNEIFMDHIDRTTREQRKIPFLSLFLPFKWFVLESKTIDINNRTTIESNIVRARWIYFAWFCSWRSSVMIRRGNGTCLSATRPSLADDSHFSLQIDFVRLLPSEFKVFTLVCFLFSSSSRTRR